MARMHWHLTTSISGSVQGGIDPHFCMSVVFCLGVAVVVVKLTAVAGGNAWGFFPLTARLVGLAPGPEAGNQSAC